MEGGAFAHFPRRGLDSRRMDVSLYRYYDIWLVGRLGGWRVGGLCVSHIYITSIYTRTRWLACLLEGGES